MPSPGEQRPYRRIFFFYVCLIYLTLPVFRNVVTWIENLFGPAAISLITPLLAVAFAGILFIWIVRNSSGPAAVLKFFTLALAGCLILLYLKGNPVEQIHLVEYGLVGFIGYLSSGARSGRASAGCILPWLLIVLVVGLLDEVIQHFLPMRVFDWRDVFINGLSAVLGFVAARVATAEIDSADGREYNEI